MRTLLVLLLASACWAESAISVPVPPAEDAVVAPPPAPKESFTAPDETSEPAADAPDADAKEKKALPNFPMPSVDTEVPVPHGVHLDLVSASTELHVHHHHHEEKKSPDDVQEGDSDTSSPPKKIKVEEVQVTQGDSRGASKGTSKGTSKGESRLKGRSKGSSKASSKGSSKGSSKALSKSKGSSPSSASDVPENPFRKKHVQASKKGTSRGRSPRRRRERRRERRRDNDERNDDRVEDRSQSRRRRHRRERDRDDSVETRKGPTSNPFRHEPDALQKDLTVALRSLAVAVASHPGDRRRNRKLLMKLRARFSRRLDGADANGRAHIQRVMKLFGSVASCPKTFQKPSRVKLCVRKFLSIDACDLRYEFNQRNHQQCVQRVIGNGPRVSNCQKRRRHAEFLLRRREDHTLAELRRKASKCTTIECNERVEQEIAEEEEAVRRSRDRRRNTWLKCDDGSTDNSRERRRGNRGGEESLERNGDIQPPPVFPSWLIVVVCGGIILVTLLVLFVSWFWYQRVQAKRLEGISAYEMTY